MPRVAFVVVTCWLVPMLGCGSPATELSSAESREASATVLVELFTSEGCSSCPPADALLSQLLEQQPIDGVQIVALAEHVDYWNYLGWTDEFSSATFSERQAEYQRTVFPSRPIYTPQLVVDGALESIGSDRDAVHSAVQKAARVAKARLRVQATRARANEVDVTLDVEIPPSLERRGPADVFVAISENELVTAVERGENRGRTLSHSAVARRLTVAGEIGATAGTFSGVTVVPLEATWDVDALRVVAFVQDRAGRMVLGAAAAPIVDER